MKKFRTTKLRIIFIFLLGLSTMLNVGCGQKWRYIKGEFVTPYYKSVVTAKEDSKLPISIRVKPINFTPFGAVNHGWGTVRSIFPLICLIPAGPTSTTTNTLGGTEAYTLTTRTPGEIEKVITEELKKTMLFNEVVFGGDQKDYDIQGTLDFKIDSHDYYGGFGGILMLVPVVLLVNVLLLPMANAYYICEAHFEVVKTDNNKIVFSKDYYSKELLVVGLLYGGTKGHETMYGKKVFPPIMKEFINDLKVNLKQNINTVWLNKNYKSLDTSK